MLNKVTLIGNLGKDPEIKTLESGTLKAIFSLATNESFKDRNGNWQKTTEWHDIVMWRALAERAKVLKKGMLVYVEGKLSHRKWQDKDGKDHYSTEIVADLLRILEKKENQVSPDKKDTEVDDRSTGESTHSPDSDDLPF